VCLPHPIYSLFYVLPIAFVCYCPTISRRLICLTPID
jgi:hypothetical protein